MIRTYVTATQNTAPHTPNTTTAPRTALTPTKATDTALRSVPADLSLRIQQLRNQLYSLEALAVAHLTGKLNKAHN